MTPAQRTVGIGGFVLLLFVSLYPSDAALAEWKLAPLGESMEDPPAANLVELGRLLFFDGRLSGDATTSCATCHDPKLAFTDGLPLSRGYPGTLYFRNTPTLYNVAAQRYLYWDGRMSGDDLPSLVRDHISEAHFMQADGRLVIERLRQVPEYERRFREATGGEPSYGRILNSVAAYVRTLRSGEAPLDRYLRGDESAMQEAATRGLELFRGKANCIACHHGTLLSDQDLHNTAVPENPDIFLEPERHITFRRFLRTIGIGQCASLRKDIGHRCVSKLSEDDGRFRTPSLREVSRTAPFMHNGVFATLKEVVDFYDQGGGASSQKDARLQPLGLSDMEKQDLVEFLQQLTSEREETNAVTLPEYELRELGEPLDE